MSGCAENGSPSPNPFDAKGRNLPSYVYFIPSRGPTGDGFQEVYMIEVPVYPKKTAFHHGMVSVLSQHNLRSIELAERMKMPFPEVANIIFSSKHPPTEEFFLRLEETGLLSGMEVEALRHATTLPYPTDERKMAEMAEMARPGLLRTDRHEEIDAVRAVLELKFGRIVFTNAGRPYRYENAALLYEKDGAWLLSACELTDLLKLNLTPFFVRMRF